MNSFFKKLKRGMKIEEELEKTEQIKKVQKPTKKFFKTKKEEIITQEDENKMPEMKVETIEPPNLLEEEKPEIKEIKGVETSVKKMAEEKKEKWLEAEGQLAIDVYQTETELVIQSAIAGVRPEDLDISIERDIINIRGNRPRPFEEKGDYFTQECYWGPFSRELVLPVEVDPERAEALMKDGILTIRLPKLLREKRRKIKVRM
jgi:HSP20 family protein